MPGKLANLLKGQGIKPTPVRILMLEKLRQKEKADSIADLETALEHIDRATLYRNLRTFEQNGLVHHIDDGTGITKYALCSDDCTTDRHQDTHVHFHCTSCGTTTCLPDTQIPVVDLPSDYEAGYYELLIKGTCAACR